MKRTPTTTSFPSITMPTPPAAARPGGPAPANWQLVVRHPNRLYQGHLQELVVEVRTVGTGPLAAGPGREPVAVRPSLPGVVVAPLEATLDPTQPSARAIFQVTAVVRGRIPGAGVEVWRHGQRLQVLATPMTAVGQGLVGWLAALALLVPLTLLMVGRAPAPPAGTSEGGVKAVWPAALASDEMTREIQAIADRLRSAAGRVELEAGLGLILLALTAGVTWARRGGQSRETVGPFPSLSAALRRPEVPPFLSPVEPEELEQIQKSHPRLGHTPG